MAKKLVAVLGAAGYIGYPLCRLFVDRGWNVVAVDNHIKRRRAATRGYYPVIDPFKNVGGKSVKSHFQTFCHYWRGLDVTSINLLKKLLKAYQPDVIVHLAEQPSAPYSMIDSRKADTTLRTNIFSTYSVLQSMIEACPTAHLIKIGTMGEYGVPSGPLVIEDNPAEGLCAPKRPQSWYHVSKVCDSALCEFVARRYSLRITDIHQGIVVGVDPRIDDRMNGDKDLTSLWVDPLFGTVVNRFCAQAAMGEDLTIYGGAQKRSFLHLRDSIRCIYGLSEWPPATGAIRVVNQFGSLHTISEIADMVQEAAQTDLSYMTVPSPRDDGQPHDYTVERHVLDDLDIAPKELGIALIRDTYMHLKGRDIPRSFLVPDEPWKGIAI